jgi:hypothetical protein
MPAPPRRPLRALGIALATFLLTSLGVELGWRLWLAASGQAYDGAKTRARVEQVATQLGRELIDYGAGKDKRNRHAHVVHPYTGFASDGLLGTLPRYIERFGKRRAKAYFDVLIVGGSVAGMTSHPLTDILPERLDGHLPEGCVGTRVTNLAMGGIKQPQQTTLTTYLFSRGIRPDAVINIDGFNEVALGNQNGLSGADPVYPSVTHWSYLLSGPPPDREMLDLMLAIREGQNEAVELAATAQRFGLLRSAVTGNMIRRQVEWLGRETAKDLSALNKRIARDAKSSTRGIAIPEERQASHPNAPVRLSVHSWFEASVSLDAMCDARDILYLQVLQPTMHDEGSKRLTAEELAAGDGNERWVAGAKAGYPMLREDGAQLRARGVRWLDASMLFAEVDDTVYIDLCHYDERGTRMLAEVITDELVQMLDER